MSHFNRYIDYIQEKFKLVKLVADGGSVLAAISGDNVLYLFFVFIDL